MKWLGVWQPSDLCNAIGMTNPATMSTLHKLKLARLLIALDFLSKYCSAVPVAWNMSVVICWAKEQRLWDCEADSKGKMHKCEITLIQWPCVCAHTLNTVIKHQHMLLFLLTCYPNKSAIYFSDVTAVLTMCAKMDLFNMTVD